MDPRDRFCYCNRLPNNSIRLLQLVQGRDDTPLACKLRDYVFHDQPLRHLVYNTLSYTWGDEPATENLICNDQDLLVTKNLYTFLQCLQRSGDDNLWWIDAVCINQADVVEKTAQVRKMKNIYSRSQKVVAWLGVEESDTKAVITLMYQLSDLMSGPLRTKARSSIDLDTHAFGLPTSTDPIWISLFRFLGKPWFHRIWIVQEIVAAPDGIFMCGNLLIPLSVLFSAAMTVLVFHNIQWERIMSTNQIADRIAQSPTAAILELFRSCHQNGIQLKIAHLMLTTKAFKSSEPRDKVFALVGLSSDVPVEFIDYSKSLQSIHIEVMQITLSEPAKFDSLAEVCFCRNIQDLPSWVPELSYHSTGFISLRFAFPHNAEAVSDEPKFRWDSQNTLFAHGKIIDQVVEVVSETPYLKPHTEILASNSALESHMASLDHWVNECEKLIAPQKKHVGGSSTSEAFWRALIFDTGHPNLPSSEALYPAYQAYRQLLRIHTTGDYERTPEEQQKFLILSSDHAFRRDVMLINLAIGFPVGFLGMSAITGNWPRSMLSWVRALTFGSVLIGFVYLLMLQCPYAVSKQDEDAEDMNKKRDEFAAQCRPMEYSMMMFLNGRKFFISNRGSIGWVSCNAKKGDKICIFQGCRIPFVIREMQDGFRLLGDCYLQGLMDGEAWISSSAKVEEIKLR